MKKSIVNVRNLVLMFAFAGLFSCEGPDGPQGPIGPTGQTGATGATGPQGPAGQDGQDGQNGNANVTVINLLATDITWVEGEYLGRPANTFALTSTAVNDDIINHGTVLGYCHIGAEWFHMPLSWEDLDGLFRQYIVHSYSPNTITIYAYQTGGVSDAGGIDEFRFMLITDNTVTGAKGATPEEVILTKLADAGVDVNDYFEVTDYFGLKH